MLSGDVNLRKSLEIIAPFQGERNTWFGSVAQRVGIPKRRVRSLFYNRQCRLWGDELARIHAALSKAMQNQNIELHQTINANAAARLHQSDIDQIKGEIRGEILEDIRALLLELRGSGDGFSIRGNGAALSRG